jgi:tetratricopeptide (TPR) repeat protein
VGLARSWNNRGLTSATLGQLESGLRDIQRAVAALQQLAGPNAPLAEWTLDLATALANQALVLADLKDSDAAIESLHQAVSYFRELHMRSPDDMSLKGQLAIALHNLSVMTQPDDRARAFELAEEAVKLQLEIAQRDPDAIGCQSDLVLSFQHLGSLALSDRRIDQAADLFRQAVQRCEQVIRRAPAYLAAGKRDASIEEFQRASKMIEDLVERLGRRPEYLSSLAGVRFNLGLAQWQGTDAAVGTTAMKSALALQQEACAARPDDGRLQEQLSAMADQVLHSQIAAPADIAATLADQLTGQETVP